MEKAKVWVGIWEDSGDRSWCPVVWVGLTEESVLDAMYDEFEPDGRDEIPMTREHWYENYSDWFHDRGDMGTVREVSVMGAALKFGTHLVIKED